MNNEKDGDELNTGNFRLAYRITFAVFWIMFLLLVIRHPDRDIWIIGTANVMLALSLDFKNRIEHQKLNNRIKQLEQNEHV